ncbi:hypothetical protein HOG16_00680 [Candidatus Woesearchaeota archaeon]|jgi:hypothetical protein|nr:hypothetical protein [Candidatus Woesearchaeota archaeon]MBT4321922.1 hypothetical protein [Candidatus Woesearchaeota archaeon]MBT4630617.1 hypothetical protein [Candidatus Woesearchaeota archaeon]
MQKRGQAAMEFLMTYGWAIMVVLLAIAALAYFLDSEELCPPNFKFFTKGFYIVDQKVIGSDVNFDPAKNLYYLIIKNTHHERVTISEIAIKKGEIICDLIDVPIELSQGETTNLVIGKIEEECQGVSKECYNFDLNIDYRDARSGIVHTVEGTISGTFEPNPNQLWILGGPWTTLNIEGNTFGIEDRTGESINYCVPESPPDSSTFTDEIPQGIVFWDLPLGCDTGGIGQIGFDSASCDGRTQLAKGWLHNTLYLDDIFSEYNIFIGGNAGYYDTVAGEDKTNGICLNDNLYFYVNGELKYWGGTTGNMVGGDDTYEGGDEVMKECSGCYDVDDSAWCIPAFELSASGFIYGESNDIDIMVEDFCWGGAQPHAGGMSELTLFLI